MFLVELFVDQKIVLLLDCGYGCIHLLISVRHQTVNSTSIESRDIFKFISMFIKSEEKRIFIGGGL